jgi:trimeric autotransporter adhesin
MSTKTTFKRVALVAVAALGLGVLSVAPSSAAVINLATSAVDGTATTATSDSTTAATVRVSFTGQANTDSVTITSYVSSKPTGSAAAAANSITVHLADTSTSTLLPVVTAGGALRSDAGTSAVTGESVTVVTAGNGTGLNSANFRYYMNSRTTLSAGTYVITSVVTPFSAGTAGTPVTRDVNIVVTAVAADSKVASASTSTAFLSSGNSSASDGQTSDSSVAVVSTAGTADIAEIRVILKNANGTASKVVESVTATITGPGVIGNPAETAYGKSLVLAYNADASITLGIRADGTAGTGTITISTPSVTFASKKVTFYASTAKTITAAANKPVIGTGAQTSVVYAKAVDANGNAWGGTAYIYASSAADALIAGSVTPSACTYVASDDVHACDVSGTLAGTAKFKIIDASTVALATATSNEVSVRVSTGVATTVKLAFDKATYAPGEKAQIWVTALDAAGLPMPATSISNFFATGGITTSVALGANSDTLTSTTIALAGATSATDGTVAGYKVYTVYMPFASGDVVITATGGTGIATSGRVATTATATIVNSSVDAATDAANEATDAANAATDAALAAADAADAATAAAQDASDAVAALSASVSKLISSLRAQITSLTNLVIKIQKKVRA